MGILKTDDATKWLSDMSCSRSEYSPNPKPELTPAAESENS